MYVVAESKTKWAPCPKMLLKNGNYLDLGNNQLLVNSRR